MNPNNIKSIYLIAICGTGMASLAGLLKESGYEVTGSDNHVYPPMGTLLAQAGIEIKSGYKKENISGAIDLVIIGNAISKTNEEAQAVLDAGIPYMSFPEALSRFFLEGRKSLVVAGTHGKTTTTALLSWVLHDAGKRPGFMVGGWLKNFNSNHRVPEGDYFVTEGDEYDTAFFDKGPKFLHYRPFASILTGIEFDHADIYNDLDHIKSSFGKFVEIVDPDGFLLVEFSDKNARDILEHAPCPVETYGFSPEADWPMDSYSFDGGMSRFTLRHKGTEVGTFSLPMVGRYNAENAAAAAVMAIKLGLSADVIAKAFAGFRGIKRRQEVVGEKNGVTVIDDFAHHPTSIRHTIEAVKEAFPGQTVWAVFEPRTATSRRNVFQDDLPESFRPADRVIVAGLHAPEKIKPEERLDPVKVIDTLRKDGRQAEYIPETDDIVEFIAANVKNNDVILVMSSGEFNGIHQKLLQRIS